VPELFVALNTAGGIAGFTNDPGSVGGMSLAGRVYRVLPAEDPKPGHPVRTDLLLEPIACETGDCDTCRRDCPAAIDYLED